MILATGMPIQAVIAQLTTNRATHPGAQIRHGKDDTRESGQHQPSEVPARQPGTGAGDKQSTEPPARNAELCPFRETHYCAMHRHTECSI